MALRALLEAEVPSSPLHNSALLFVPAFNTDGHERVGRWNRPNQAGPEETGWRTTAHNLNLNRDYMKADAPEMRAMLRLLQKWDPLVCADLHVTDGADFEPDVSIQVEPIHQGDPGLQASALLLRDRLIETLAAQGSLPLSFYPDLVWTDDPSSGFVLTVYSPRFSTGYFPARNRFSVLVETHSWKDYARRVRVTLNAVLGLVEPTARHGREWLDQVRRADQAGQEAGGREPTSGAIAAQPYDAGDGMREVEVFRASRAVFANRPFEGRMRMTLEGEWRPETRRLPANSILVPIAKPRALLLMGLLEPRAPDSLAAWGFFNACFEQKEHVEPYVAELPAREMLAADPRLEEEFKRALAADPAGPTSPVSSA